MRIAIATDDGTNVAAHTGRCRSFAIFDVEGQAAKQVELRANRFTTHAQGQCEGGTEVAAHAHHQHSHAGLLAALADCRVLVARGMGPRLHADLAAHGIDAYVCDVLRVAEAATRYARGALARATSTTCTRHG